jgi:hypothetical protein
MKANWAIWNKAIILLSSIVLIWAIAPRHDCFCGEMQATESPASAHHDCCQAEDDSSCENDEQADSQTNCEHSFQKKSCNCSSERVLYRETRNAKTLPKSSSLPPKTMIRANGVTVVGSRCPLDRQNDELKPSRLFLLKRALLN